MLNVTLQETSCHVSACPQADAAVVLLVDDDIRILSSLRRLLRPKGYRVLTAQSGADGLALLKRYPVDLIVSDMRMPQMNGAQLLSKARELCPDTVRVLLTAYAEIDTAIEAINDGGVAHYLQKPWDDQNLSLTLAQALEQQQQKKQALALSEQRHRHNTRLLECNQALELQVDARTEEIRQTVLFMERAQQELKDNLVTTLKVFSNLVELRNGMLGGQSLRVAQWMRRLGHRFGHSEMACTELWMAGLLHALGKIGLPDELISKPMEKMSGDELRHFTAHPLTGQMALTPLSSLNGVGRIIRYQYERFDGRGCPESLVGQAIPYGARMLAVTRDFEALRIGAISMQPLPAERALKVIQAQRGHRYDPQIVDAFLAMIAAEGLQQTENTRSLRSYELLAGMQLAEDLHSHGGFLLLPRDSILSQHNIAQIKKLEKMDNIILQIIVWKENDLTVEQGTAPSS